IVSPSHYNQVHTTTNMNAIKAKLHNQAYLNLAAKHKLPSFCIVDQFAPKPMYYSYLRTEPNVVRTLHFETKAENKYPAVGAASILARNAFLEYMDKMEEYYGMKFAKGSGAPADRCATEFVERFGKEKLGEVAKLHFKNTEKLK
ncbi:MAG: ribonuclease HIII, partial [Solobacterium sp.]|nr:ribonuclease HIII [Solobacterium sp.]